jgi:hypothetical protein
MPYFKEIIDGIIQDEMDRFEETEDEDEKENLKETIDYYTNALNNPREMYEIIDNFGYDTEQIMHMVSFETLERMILNFLAEEIFPAWYDKWSQEGLEGVREDNEELAAGLRNINNLPFEQRFVILNRALHGVHITGDMLNYIEQKYYDVNKNFLDSLSNSDTTEWDQDIRGYGLS